MSTASTQHSIPTRLRLEDLLRGLDICVNNNLIIKWVRRQEREKSDGRELVSHLQNRITLNDPLTKWKRGKQQGAITL